MKVKAKINQVFYNDRVLKGFATIFLDNEFLITGIRILNFDDRLVVAMPCRKDTKGIYKDICFPINMELREKIKEKVLQEYSYKLNQNKI